MKLTASLVSALVCLSSVQGHATDEDQIVMKYVGTGEPTKPKGRSPEDPFIYVQRQQKLKDAPKPPRTASSKDPVPKHKDPMLMGLPSMIVAELDPEFIKKEAGSMAYTEPGKEGTAQKVSLGDEATGTMICKRLAFAMKQATDVSCDNVNWMKDKNACLFQVMLDENPDDVSEWLAEQPAVLSVSGSSPLDQIEKRWV